MTMRWAALSRFGFAAVAAAAVVAMVASTADARPGRGGSFGSRGDRTYSAPPTTNTAPKTAAPIDKSMSQPGAAASKGVAGAGSTVGTATQASRFGGMRGLLMGGLFAAAFAGIFGVGALASALGFLLQAVLIGGIVWFALNWYRNRQAGGAQPAMAGAARTRQADVDPNLAQRQAAGGTGAGASNAAVELTKADFDAFEARLGDIQTAYGRNDQATLARLTTPEMLSYFARELADNTANGVRNEVSSPKLLQGDLSEAWREIAREYATVAMRYSVIGVMVETATGKIVAGSRTTPDEITEVWTFTRMRGGKPGDWELSAIQQA